MSKLIRILALAVPLACGGDDPTGPSGGSHKVLTMTVNGTAWTATIVTGAWASGQLAIGGSNPTAGTLNISALNITGPGTYQLGPGNPNTAIATYIANAGYFSSAGTGGTGTITLTTVSFSRVAGTFSFTASYGAPVQTVVITAGQFDISNP